jgi:trans-aconitate methyltransferase
MPTDYSWDPSGYERSSGPQARAAEEFLSRLQLQPDDVILDIGCGDGRHTAFLATRVHQGRVLGIDSSTTMIEFARNRYLSRSCANLDFAVQDARAVAFNAEFSVVFSTSALHWIEDHSLLLPSIARALRTGGRFYMQMLARDGYEWLTSACAQVIQDLPWRDYFQGFSLGMARYDAAEYQALLRGAGFVPDEVSVLVRDVIFPDRVAVSTFLRAVAHPYTSRLPVGKHASFADSVVERLMRAQGDVRNREIVVSAKRLCVMAHRP